MNEGVSVKSKFLGFIIGKVLTKMLKKNYGIDCKVFVDSLKLEETEDNYTNFNIKINGFVKDNDLDKLIDQLM